MYYIPSRNIPENVYLPKEPFKPKDTYPSQLPNGRKTVDFDLEEEYAKMHGDDFDFGREGVNSEKSIPAEDFDFDEDNQFTSPHKMAQTTENKQKTGFDLTSVSKLTGGIRSLTKSQIALNQFKKTQLSKGKYRSEVAGLQNPEPAVKQYGFRTRFILNDVLTDKAQFARDARNAQAKKGKEEFVPHEFNPYKDPVFRDLDLPFGK
jgi:hypothetical protein